MTTSVKTCFKCGEDKALTDFYKHPAMSDGRVNKCKECNKLDVRRNRADKVEYYREFDRKRGARQTSEDCRAQRAKYPEKYKARSAVSNAIRDGKLKKGCECEGCGCSGRIEGHHEDYSKPLEVVWLCSACHKAVHALERFK